MHNMQYKSNVFSQPALLDSMCTVRCQRSATTLWHRINVCISIITAINKKQHM